MNISPPPYPRSSGAMRRPRRRWRGRIWTRPVCEALKEYAELEPVVKAARALSSLQNRRSPTSKPCSPPVRPMRTCALAQEGSAVPPRPGSQRQNAPLRSSFCPRMRRMRAPRCSKSALAPGGDEVALFAGDLLRMYQRYADEQGWKIEVIPRPYPSSRAASRKWWRPSTASACSQAEVREWRAPRAAQACRLRIRRAYPYFCSDCCGTA